MKALPSKSKKALVDDDECEMHRKPMAVSCGNCGHPHVGIDGHLVGKGHGNHANDKGNVAGLWTP